MSQALMSSLFQRNYTPLPSRNTVSGLPPTSPALRSLHLIRSRLFFTVLATLITLFLLVSTFSSSSISTLYGYSSRRNPSFPSAGLKQSLWKDLNAIPWRTLILEPTTEAFERETSQDMPVPWSNFPLLPKTPLLQPDGSKAPIPSHRIKVLPRVVALSEQQQRRTQVDRMMFGTVTTVARAKDISELWSRWLIPFDETYGFGNDSRSSSRKHAASVVNPEAKVAKIIAGKDSSPHSASAVSFIDGVRPACLILVSVTEKPKEIEELRAILVKRGMDCRVQISTEPRYEIRVMSMIKEMRDYADSLERTFDWFVFGDDDTFWLDLRTLRRMLSKYDHTQEWFVGATSEAKNQLESFGRMAFGGAGILVSDPLMEKMFDVWDDCYKQFRHVFGGDEMLTRCAALAKGASKQTVTTEEKGLHQFDVPGDTTGVFQSGIPFVNLHHYLGGAWVHLFGYGTYMSDMEQIRLIQRVVGFLGGDNMFKRYSFGDGKWLLTQGYSLTLFEGRGVGRSELALMEHTWYDGYRLSYDDRPVTEERHAAPGTQVKQTFYIDDIKILSPSSAIFVYAQADKWDEHMSKSQRVRIEVLWDGCWNGAAPDCHSGEVISREKGN